MSGGQALNTFTDFVIDTGVAIFDREDKIINDAVNQTWTLGRFLKGREMSDILQGGSRIKDVIMFDEASTFRHYKPNATFSPQNPQVLTEWYAEWRFSIDEMAWVDQQIELNIPKGMGKKGKFQTYKKEKTKLEQRTWTSMLKGVDSCFWANPHGTAMASSMEAQAGDTPYSIPVFVTEDTTLYHPYQWTTIMNIDPGTEPGWRNQVRRYDYADILDNDGDLDGLLNAFDDMWLDVDFKPPPMHEQHFEPETDMRRCAIFCSNAGKTQYIAVCRLLNDRFAKAGGQDPSYPGVNYNGVDLVHIKALGTATLYNASNSFYAELSTSLSASGTWSATDMRRGPRYFWINGNYLRTFFHENRYFKQIGPMTHPNQPMSHVIYHDLWWNTVARSRKRHGIIGPGANVGTAP